MEDQSSSHLEMIYGRHAAEALASAYESATNVCSKGEVSGRPDRATRLAFIDAMLREADRNGFDAARLVDAALATIRPH